MAFTSVVKSEPVKKNQGDWDIEQSDSSQKESKDDKDIHEAFDQLYVESLKLKKVNSSALKRLHELELKK